METYAYGFISLPAVMRGSGPLDWLADLHILPKRFPEFPGGRSRSKAIDPEAKGTKVRAVDNLENMITPAIEI